MSEIASFCPHCGFSLTEDGPLVLGRWRVTPHSTELDGRAIRLSSCENLVLYTLAKADGEPVKVSVIGERATFAADDLAGIVRVWIRRLRIKLPEVPFETVWGIGYRWTGETLRRAA